MESNQEDNLDNFISNYELDKESQHRQLLIAIYYSFTTLSTVGFGDFHPINSHEAIVCVFMVLFGNLLFSVVMGIFLGMLEKFKMVNSDLEDESGLS